jgi:ribosomal protein L12E/L44/L45/RPP1/RPP2
MMYVDVGGSLRPFGVMYNEIKASLDLLHDFSQRLASLAGLPAPSISSLLPLPSHVHTLTSSSIHSTVTTAGVPLSPSLTSSASSLISKSNSSVLGKRLRAASFDNNDNDENKAMSAKETKSSPSPLSSPTSVSSSPSSSPIDLSTNNSNGITISGSGWKRRMRIRHRWSQPAAHYGISDDDFAESIDNEHHTPVTIPTSTSKDATTTSAASTTTSMDGGISNDNMSDIPLDDDNDSDSDDDDINPSPVAANHTAAAATTGDDTTIETATASSVAERRLLEIEERLARLDAEERKAARDPNVQRSVDVGGFIVHMNVVNDGRHLLVAVRPFDGDTIHDTASNTPTLSTTATTSSTSSSHMNSGTLASTPLTSVTNITDTTPITESSSTATPPTLASVASSSSSSSSSLVPSMDILSAAGTPDAVAGEGAVLVVQPLSNADDDDEAALVVAMDDPAAAVAAAAANTDVVAGEEPPNNNGDVAEEDDNDDTDDDDDEDDALPDNHNDAAAGGGVADGVNDGDNGDVVPDNGGDDNNDGVAEPQPRALKPYVELRLYSLPDLTLVQRLNDGPHAQSDADAPAWLWVTAYGHTPLPLLGDRHYSTYRGHSTTTQNIGGSSSSSSIGGISYVSGGGGVPPLSSCSPLIASGGEDQKLHIWSTDYACKITNHSSAHTNGVNAVQWCPTPLAATASSFDGATRANKPVTCSCCHRLRPSDPRYRSTFGILATASDDSTVRLWF